MIYNPGMKSALENLLQEHLPFSAGTPGTLNQLAGSTILRSYRSGEYITRSGDSWPYLFIVSQGKVNALKESREGRSLVVAEILPGDVFWGLAFFEEDVPNPVSLVCHQDSSLYLWQREQMLPILLENGRLAWGLSRLMVARMLHASEFIEGLAFQPVAGRLARLLLDHFESAGDSSISRNLTLDEMAARIGSTREMVCRALYSFSDKKLIEVTRTEFVLTDRDGLSHLVER